MTFGSDAGLGRANGGSENVEGHTERIPAPGKICTGVLDTIIAGPPGRRVCESMR